jgi:hypothetical protein
MLEGGKFGVGISYGVRETCGDFASVICYSSYEMNGVHILAGY